MDTEERQDWSRASGECDCLNLCFATGGPAGASWCRTVGGGDEKRRRTAEARACGGQVTMVGMCGMNELLT